MAKMTVNFPDELQSKITKLGRNTDEITAKMLQAGAEVVLPKVEEGLNTAIGNTQFESRSTGELEGSLGVSSVLIDKNGNANIKIGFREPRKKQYAAKGKRSYNEITNAMIANVLEYGKKSANQPAKPFLKPAIAKTRKKCREVMQKTLEEEIEKL